jgi:hypothetical protein
MAQGESLLTASTRLVERRRQQRLETALTWIKGALGAGLTKHLSAWDDVLADAIWMRRQRPCPQPEKPAFEKSKVGRYPKVT